MRYANKRHLVATVGLMAAASLVGCTSDSKKADGAGNPAVTAATTKPVAAKPAEAKKDPTYYEFERDGKVFVYGSIPSANAHLEGKAPADPVVKEKFSKTGKTVIFENVGANTDALVAAWAKANGVAAK